MVKNFIYKLTLLIFIAFSGSVNAFDSPTHYQLYQLTQLDRDAIENIGELNNTINNLNDSATVTLTRIESDYNAYISDKSKFPGYTDSIESLINSILLPRAKKILESERSILLLRDVITTELTANQEGKIIFWRYNNMAGNKNDPDYTSTVSFSAPGILAGFLDGIYCYMSQTVGQKSSGCACTFIYTINAIEYMHINSEQGFRKYVKKTNAFLRTINENIPNLDNHPLPSRAEYVRSTDAFIEAHRGDMSNEQTLYYNNLCEYGAYLKQTFIRQHVDDTELMGIKLEGTYDNHPLKDKSDSISPEHALFGKGMAFHPSFSQADYKEKAEIIVLREFKLPEREASA